MVRYLQSWMDQLRWQRLRPFQKLALMIVDHLDGILNYCRTKVPLGVVEAVNGNIKALLRRGRGYKNLRYLLLKAQRMAVAKTEFVVMQKAAYNGPSPEIPLRARITFAELSRNFRELTPPTPAVPNRSFCPSSHARVAIPIFAIDD